MVEVTPSEFDRGLRRYRGLLRHTVNECDQRLIYADYQAALRAPRTAVNRRCLHQRQLVSHGLRAGSGLGSGRRWKQDQSGRISWRTTYLGVRPPSPHAAPGREPPRREPKRLSDDVRSMHRLARVEDRLPDAEVTHPLLHHENGHAHSSCSLQQTAQSYPALKRASWRRSAAVRIVNFSFPPSDHRHARAAGELSARTHHRFDQRGVWAASSLRLREAELEVRLRREREPAIERGDSGCPRERP